MSNSSSEITGLLSERGFPYLREYFGERPVEFIALFEQYVYNQDWCSENPVLGLKAFALLDPKDQQSEVAEQVLRIIFAREVLGQDNSGVVKSVLSDAVRNNNWALVFKLISYGVSKEIALDFGNTLLHLACSYSMSAEALKLIDNKSVCGLANSEGNTPLHLASKNGLVEVCRALLEMGADPLRKNNQGFSPLFYACEKREGMALDLMKSKCEAILWETQLAEALLALERKDEALWMIDAWKRRLEPWEYIRNALKCPLLLKVCMQHSRLQMESCLAEIRRAAEELPQKMRLSILPLLEPEEIVRTIRHIPPEESELWMRTLVIVEEDISGSLVKNTVEGGLIEVNEQWIPFIVWDDPDQANNSSWYINKLSSFLNQIPLPTLSFAAMSPELSPVLETCLRIMDADQMNVVIPHMPKAKFAALASSLCIQSQIGMLKGATDEQKIAYIEKIPLPCEGIVRSWYLYDYEELVRGLDALTEMKYRSGGNPESLFSSLLIKFQGLEAALPQAALREKRLLESLKRVLLFNAKRLEIIRFSKYTIGSWIEKNTFIEHQLDTIRKGLQVHPLFKTVGRKEDLPPEFLCGIMQDVMSSPVTAHGHSFEKEAIERWLMDHDDCPICRVKVKIEDFLPNEALKEKIRKHLSA